MKILIAANSSWNLVNYRLDLIKAMLLKGHEVIALAPLDQYSKRLEEVGCKFFPLIMSSRGRNPFSDSYLFLLLLIILIKERAACLLTFTIKLNVYGSIAAKLTGTKAIVNISGLGNVFSSKGELGAGVRLFYRVSLACSDACFFQNSSDEALFLREGLVESRKSFLVPGSGVNLCYFKRVDLPKGTNCSFVFVGRLLWEKGVYELAEATKLLKESGLIFDLTVVGIPQVVKSGGVPMDFILRCQKEGLFTYKGETDDVRQIISLSDCLVLPTFYGEGTPRALLEASAMGRPVITTDTPGCSDVVLNNVTGYLCAPKDVEDLAAKMEMMISIGKERRAEMGFAARRKVERDYDERIVMDLYFRTMIDLGLPY